jgi:hypothetical protein
MFPGKLWSALIFGVRWLWAVWVGTRGGGAGMARCGLTALLFVICVLHGLNQPSASWRHLDAAEWAAHGRSKACSLRDPG